MGHANEGPDVRVQWREEAAAVGFGEQDLAATTGRVVHVEVPVFEPVVEERTISPDRFIARLEDNVFSWTWALDDATRHRAGAEVRAWALERLGSLDRPQPATVTVAYRAYDLA